MENAAMTIAPPDAKLSRLLSLSVHEFRSPISVVSGYLRMVLKDPTGSLDERYKRMLEEAEKSCSRLTTLVAEMSDLSALEAGTTSFKKAPIDIRTLLADAIAALPPLADRTVEVQLTTGTGPAVVQGDATTPQGRPDLYPPWASPRDRQRRHAGRERALCAVSGRILRRGSR